MKIIISDGMSKEGIEILQKAGIDDLNTKVYSRRIN